MLFKDRVKETTTTTGTGDITTAGAVTGFITCNTAFGTGSTNKFGYVIDSPGGSEWEVGEGYMSASTTLVRSAILASSNAGAAVSFSAGTKYVRGTLPAIAMQNVVAVLSSTTVDTDIGTKQNLYTVPTGKKCVVTYIVLRSAAADLSGYNGSEIEPLIFGFNAGATDTAIAEVLSRLDASTNYQTIWNIGSTNADTTSVIGNAGDVLGVIFQDTSIDTTVVIDVIGYLYDA